MLFSLLLFSFILAFFWAKLEIEIEGKNGWASGLPTWRFQNKLTNFILSGAPLTGYHVWLIGLLFLAFHLPFFTHLEWTLSRELAFIGVFLLFIIIEDFLWFILNPAYGLSKFKKNYISWHKHWLWIVPAPYVVVVLTGIILIFLPSNSLG